MKKIAAFMMALVLFAVTAVGIHLFAGKRIEANNREFGTWISSKKDLSYSAVAANLHDDTYLLLGSSEFQYGQDTPYHPTAVFGQAELDVMCIGAAGNQCLPHAITMGALAPELKSKKVILLVSPTWFGKHGIDANNFSARFSESMYRAMLENESLSDELKEKLIARTDELLAVSPSMQENTERATRVLMGKESLTAAGSVKPLGLEDKVNFYMHSFLAQEKERISAGLMWKLSGHENYDEYKTGQISTPNWQALKEQADREFAAQCSNDFAMQDKLFNAKCKPAMKSKKDSETKRTFASSPEYDDLRLFLAVCADQGIEAELVLLPINGYWYDFTGFPRENREVIVENVQAVADEFGVPLHSFFDQCYTKGWMADNTHPAGRGWTEINEEVFEFFTADQENAG